MGDFKYGELEAGVGVNKNQDWALSSTLTYMYFRLKNPIGLKLERILIVNTNTGL